MIQVDSLVYSVLLKDAGPPTQKDMYRRWHS